MTELVKKSFIKYLTIKKHTFGKYKIEIFNVFIDDEDETVHVDLNVIPTENETSYIYSGFECNVLDVCEEICTLLSIKLPEVVIENRYFNGSEVNSDDYSISKKFELKILRFINRKMSVLSMTQYINGKKAVLKFYCDYLINYVDGTDQQYFTFFIDGTVNKFTIDDVEQKNLSDEIKEKIATYLPYLFDGYRESVEDDIWRLLGDEQKILYCDIYFTCIFDYNKVLGDSVVAGYAGNSEFFKSAIQDYVNGDY